MEEGIVGLLREQILTVDTVDQVIDAMIKARHERKAGAKERRTSLTAKVTATERQIDRLTNAIAAAGHSTALITKLTELEAIRTQLKSDLTIDEDPDITFDRPASEDVKLLIDTFFDCLPSILDAPLAGDEATWFPVIRGMIEKIVVEPTETGAQLTIKANPIGLFDAMNLAQHMIDPALMSAGSKASNYRWLRGPDLN